MQIKVKLIQLLPLQSGMGRNGEWKKQDIIVESTESQYPKKICISIWGDKIDPAQLQVGNDLAIDFDVESREFNGRWYTDVKAWKIEVVSMQKQEQGAPPMADYNYPEMPPAPPAPPAPPTPPAPEFDDLPF